MGVANLYQKALDLQAAVPYKLGDGWAFAPAQVICFLTYNCNLKCEMCNFTDLVQEVRDNVGSELSAEEIIAALDQLPSHSLVTFSGGEPTMKRGFEEILVHTAARRKCHMITNGTRLTEERSKFLVDLGCRNLLSKGFVSMGISIEGPSEAHDAIVGLRRAHEKAVAGVGYVQAEKKRQGKKYPLLHLSVVINASTAPYLSHVYELANELGVEMCNFILHNTSWHVYRYDENTLADMDNVPPPQEPIEPAILDEQFSRIRDLQKRSSVEVRFSTHGITLDEMKNYYQNKPTLDSYFCRAPWTTMLLTPKGLVMPCYYAPVGNVREHSIKELWNNWAAKEFRQKLKKEGIRSGCLGCCNAQFGTGKAQPIFS